MPVTLRKKQLRNGRFSYYLDIYHNKQRTKVTLFTVDKKDDKKEMRKSAEAIRSQKALQLVNAGTDYIPSFMKNVGVLKYCDDFIVNYTKPNVVAIQNSIKKLRSYFVDKKIKEDILLSQLNEKHLKGFIDYLNNGCGLNGETPQNYWKKFKMILNQAVRKKLLDASIFDDVKFHKKISYSNTTIKKQVLTEEEIKILWDTDCESVEIKKAFLYACYTGLGYAEIKSLTWKNIVNDKVVTNRMKTGTKIQNAHSPKIIEALGERKADDVNIFNLQGHKGQKYLTEATINRKLNIWMAKANINKHITFYCGRHTFAVRLLVNGANLKTVADAMGHTDTMITSKYLNYVNQQKDTATSELE